MASAAGVTNSLAGARAPWFTPDVQWTWRSGRIPAARSGARCVGPWHRVLRSLLAAAWAWGIALPVAAQAVASLAGPAGAPAVLDARPAYASALASHIEYWIDREGQAELSAVATARELPWQPLRPDQVLPLGGRAAVWMRFSMAPLPMHQHWYVEIPFASLNLVTLSSRGADGRWTTLRAGDRIAVADWAVPGRQPLLPLTLSAREVTQHWLRVQHAFPTSVPVFAVEEHQLLRRERLVSLGLGVYFGLTLLATVLTLAAAVWMRDSAAALFVLPALLLGLSAATFAGIGGWLLWPRHPGWADLSSFVLPVLALLATLAFVTVASGFAHRVPRLRRLPWGVVGAGLLLALALAWLPEAWQAGLTALYGTLALLLCIALPGWAWWRGGDRHALGLLIGMVCLAGPASTHILRLLGIMPTGIVSRFVLLSGAALQLAVVLSTLIWRGRDRTLTLQRMRGLDRTDPATGLASPTALQQALRRMTARAQRQNYSFALLMIDLVNLAEMRGRFGRRAEQELPIRLADRLLNHMREVDMVGRLGDKRFVMLMEGPLGPAYAEERAYQLVARCTEPVSGRPEGWAPQLRVALGIMPRDGRDPRQLLDQMAVLLDTVAPGDRRTVFKL